MNLFRFFHEENAKISTLGSGVSIKTIPLQNCQIIEIFDAKNSNIQRVKVTPRQNNQFNYIRNWKHTLLRPGRGVQVQKPVQGPKGVSPRSTKQKCPESKVQRQKQFHGGGSGSREISVTVTSNREDDCCEQFAKKFTKI